MKHSHNRSIYVGAAVVILLNCSGCGKYEDGPKFTLRTKQDRLLGEWVVEKIDNEKPDDGDLILEFERDGEFTFSYNYSYYGQTYFYGYKGEWEWENNKEVIELTVMGQRFNWEVNRLTNDELWFTDNEDSDWECEKLK